MFCLTVPTDAAWAAHALADLDRVLIDHAHCELKAATNAMSLVARYPDRMELALALTALAEEELDHFRRVLKEMQARGLTLGAPPVDPYAVQLRQAASKLPARHDERLVFVDRLLVGALIEARSCERFKILGAALAAAGREPKLVDFYQELFACEARHYRTYVDLAKHALVSDPRTREDSAALDRLLEERLHALAVAEGCIVQELADGEQARETAEPLRATVHG